MTRTPMQIVSTVERMRQLRRSLAGPVGLVPTMGALHAGHLAHVSACRPHADHVIVSIFVNPTQFGPNEDYQHYPRPIEQDLAACEQAGVDAVFAPDVDQMYPPRTPTASVDVPSIGGELEGAHRPGHFQGVCRVVLKLLNIVQPHVATFGRKDLQQLRVIQALAADLMLDVDVIEVPTVREDDGLALSSRNQYLSAEQRRHAIGLYKALQQAQQMIEQEGAAELAAVEQAMRQLMQAHSLAVDYAVVRHPRTLAALDIIDPGLTGGVAALVAARVGDVRLIDNMLIATDGGG